jgi:hypothetical protein
MAPHVIHSANEFRWSILGSVAGVIKGKKMSSIKICGYLNRHLGSVFSVIPLELLSNRLYKLMAKRGRYLRMPTFVIPSSQTGIFLSVF